MPRVSGVFWLKDVFTVTLTIRHTMFVNESQTNLEIW